MKRKGFIALALAISCLLALNLSAFAETAPADGKTLHDHSENAIIANDYEIQISKEAVEKMEAYLDTLDVEARQLIAEDQELVQMMQQDFYWAPQAPRTTRASVTLPLSGYGDGTYYTYNGSACTCHSYCTYSIPSGGTTTRCYNTNTGSSGNCKRYTGTGSIQCKGFADYVFKQYTGSDVSSTSAVSDCPSSITNDSAGQTKIKNFLSGLTVGSNIRVKVRNASYNHSFIITKITADGITLYDCNGTSSACKVRVITRTWAQLTSAYSGVVSAWEA